MYAPFQGKFFDHHRCPVEDMQSMSFHDWFTPDAACTSKFYARKNANILHLEYFVFPSSDNYEISVIKDNNTLW